MYTIKLQELKDVARYCTITRNISVWQKIICYSEYLIYPFFLVFISWKSVAICANLATEKIISTIFYINYWYSMIIRHQQNRQCRILFCLYYVLFKQFKLFLLLLNKYYWKTFYFRIFFFIQKAIFWFGRSLNIIFDSL